MYLRITLVSMKDVSNTVNHVTMLKKTQKAGTVKEANNKYTAGLANRPMFITGA